MRKSRALPSFDQGGKTEIKNLFLGKSKRLALSGLNTKKETDNEDKHRGNYKPNGTITKWAKLDI
jgi:hypothetical protein